MEAHPRALQVSVHQRWPLLENAPRVHNTLALCLPLGWHGARELGGRLRGWQSAAAALTSLSPWSHRVLRRILHSWQRILSWLFRVRWSISSWRRGFGGEQEEYTRNGLGWRGSSVMRRGEEKSPKDGFWTLSRCLAREGKTAPQPTIHQRLVAPRVRMR